MLEVGAALCAGLGVTLAVLTLAVPIPRLEGSFALGQSRRFALGLWARERALADSAGWHWSTVGRLVTAEAIAAVVGGGAAALVTGLVALSVPGAVGSVAIVRLLVSTRVDNLRRRRQDAVLESVRMLRQLLETGATGVHQGIAILGERGPAPLRHEFRNIATVTSGRRRAWAAARSRIGEPLFDLLAAAVLVQRPGGGELAPLFSDLEVSVTAAQEVEREAEALQAQARSAAAIIVSLPIAFLVVMSMMRSPYLDAFHAPAGEAFLVSMLAVMGVSYAWIRRLLRLPGLARVRLADA